MRVGFLLPFHFSLRRPGNGIYEQAINQINSLSKLGVEVTLLSPWELKETNKFDIVHLFEGGDGCAEFINIPCKKVISPIIDSNRSNLLYRIAVEATRNIKRFNTTQKILFKQFNAADLILVRSRHEKERVEQGYGIYNKTKIVLNGVTDFSNIVARKPNIEFDFNKKFAVTLSAYSQERKNTQNFLDSIKNLNLALDFLFFGYIDDDYRNNLIQKYKNYENFHFFSVITEEEKKYLFSKCDFFFLPSKHEGTGLSALEARSLGAKVLITKFGGTKDYFDSHCHFINPYSKNDMRRKVEAIIKQSNNKIIGKILSWHDSAKVIIDLYSSLLEQ